MHQSSLDKMANFYAQYLRDLPADPKGPRTVLDLGSQDINGSYRSIFEPEKWRYVGVDMTPGKNVDVVLADPYRWREFRTASVDCVISGQAFEHTEFFWLSMEEIARVLKPGALCCII
ncbi:MAG: methyltransferase domain-containing protein, partial [Verrucomicrobia bacterium]|nr:methyltransferase domain-containing protein [Verrucomicrobiota bacterium]